MRELIDCHIHTVACGHARGTVAEMVDAAVTADLTGIVMTEHLPLPADFDPHRHLAPYAGAFSAYAEEVRATRETSKLTIVLGAEADWLPERPEAMDDQMTVARAAGVEVLLGSVHAIDGWVFDDPTIIEQWDARDIDQVWETYFALWCDAARSGRFDVMAHPDLPKKFGHRPRRDPRELYAEAAAAAAHSDVLIEVSTAGLRKPVGELYPGPELLRAFASAGVGATVGSDAHAPTEVGYRLHAAHAALADAGVTRIALPLPSRDRRWIEL